MAAVNFYLKEPNADKDTPIMVMLSVDGNRFKMYTGLKTHPKQWDADKQRVRKNNSGSVELNGRLSSIEKGLPKTYYLLTEEEGITYTQVQDKLKASIQTEKPKKQRELIEVFDEFMEEKASLVKPLTMKKYKTLKNLLLNFSNLKHRKLEFSLVDERFDISFRNYLIQELTQSNDTISKYYDCLKVFLGWALERGYHKNKAYEDFEAKRSKKDVIYLTEKELLAIYHLGLTENSRLSRIRDLFCFMCFTGQRFSDVCNLKWTDLKEYDNCKEWHLYQIKGNKPRKVIVPLSAYASQIMSRYKSSDPSSKVFHAISNQKANDFIKELGQLAKIDEPTTTVKYSGKNRIESMLPKYNFLSTHTGRRTFVTLSLEKGMRPETVQEITGHEDYRTLKKYIKITDKVKAVEMHKVWSNTPFTKVG